MKKIAFFYFLSNIFFRAGVREGKIKQAGLFFILSFVRAPPYPAFYPYDYPAQKNLPKRGKNVCKSPLQIAAKVLEW